MTSDPSIDKGAAGILNDAAISALRQRVRVIQLLDAAERVALCPLRAHKLHAFAYLADVLSPVWDLPTFEGTVLKVAGGPHYPDLQQELDRLVALGLVSISDLEYISRPDGGARIDGFYSLRLQVPTLEKLLEAIGARGAVMALDSKDATTYEFLLDLAGALATVPDEEIDRAATFDATYADSRIDDSNVIDFGQWSTNTDLDNLSLRTVRTFPRFLPEDVRLSGGEKLYLYASFLGRRVHER